MPFSKFQPRGELVLFNLNIFHFFKKIKKRTGEKYLARACSFTVDCWGFSRSLLRIPRVERISRVNMLAEALKCLDYIMWYKSSLTLKRALSAFFWTSCASSPKSVAPALPKIKFLLGF